MARPRSDIQRRQTGVRLRPETYRAVQHFAVDEGKPVSTIIEQAIEEFLARRGVAVPPPDLAGSK
ncbi:hypothetical protein JCM30471_27360 [Desulfuromonas carbonis]